MVPHLFHGPKNGYVARTVDFRLLATDADFFGSVGCLLEDIGISSQTITEAMENGLAPMSGIIARAATLTTLTCLSMPTCIVTVAVTGVQ
jgi:hypothetical protein